MDQQQPCDADAMWRASSIDENNLELNALGLLHFLDQRRHDVEQVSDDSDIGDLEDRCLRVFVDSNNTSRALHTYDMLDRSADAQRQIQLRRDRLPRRSHLARPRP